MAIVDNYRVFEYVIFWVPTDREYEKDGMRPNVLAGPKVVVARSADQAKTLAAREIPDAYVEDLEQVVVQVRPF